MKPKVLRDLDQTLSWTSPLNGLGNFAFGFCFGWTPGPHASLALHQAR